MKGDAFYITKIYYDYRTWYFKARMIVAVLPDEEGWTAAMLDFDIISMARTREEALDLLWSNWAEKWLTPQAATTEEKEHLTSFVERIEEHDLARQMTQYQTVRMVTVLQELVSVIQRDVRQEDWVDDGEMVRAVHLLDELEGE